MRRKIRLRGILAASLAAAAACSAVPAERPPERGALSIAGVSYDGTAAGVTDDGEPSSVRVGTDRHGTVEVRLWAGATGPEVALAVLNALEREAPAIRATSGDPNQLLVVLEGEEDAFVWGDDDVSLESSSFFAIVDGSRGETPAPVGLAGTR